MASGTGKRGQADSHEGLDEQAGILQWAGTNDQVEIAVGGGIGAEELQVHGQLRVNCQKLAKKRPENRAGEHYGRSDAQSSAWFGEQRANFEVGLFGLLHHALAAIQIYFARLGERDAASGPLHQTNSQSLFQSPQRPAHAGFRNAEALGCDGEAPRLGQLNEHPQCIQVGEHCSRIATVYCVRCYCFKRRSAVDCE
jgi:hypothetical protein